MRSILPIECCSIHTLFSKHIIWTLIAISVVINGHLLAVQDFRVIERRIVGGNEFYLSQITKGVELYNNSQHRLSIVSENQSDYPVPQSGCGPTAMLSILMWYEDYGIIKSLNRDMTLRHYKLSLFREIDNHLMKQAGIKRTEKMGVRNLDIAVTMDFMFEARSRRNVRIHTELKPEPIRLRDFLRTTLNFRSGLLIVAPKDPHTGELMNTHATVVIHADKKGYITLGTWGQLYRGLLEERSDGQWFIPQDPNHMELKIRELILFIPFQPQEQ
jgi:hypothetical protein